MHPVWAQRRKEGLSDGLVSPDVFTQMVERLGEFVRPYQHALETEASGYHVHLSLPGLLSHLERKNAEKIATFVDVERQVIQDCIGTIPWDHRPLVPVFVGQVAARLGAPTVTLSAKGECDEASGIAGHQGQPEVVKSKGRQSRRRRRQGNVGRGTMEKERPPVFGMRQHGGQVVIHLLANVQQKTTLNFWP
jgi:hypothetical protein